MPCETQVLQESWKKGIVINTSGVTLLGEPTAYIRSNRDTVLVINASRTPVSVLYFGALHHSLNADNCSIHERIVEWSRKGLMLRLHQNTLNSDTTLIGPLIFLRRGIGRLADLCSKSCACMSQTPHVLWVNWDTKPTHSGCCDWFLTRQDISQSLAVTMRYYWDSRSCYCARIWKHTVVIGQWKAILFSSPIEGIPTNEVTRWIVEFHCRHCTFTSLGYLILALSD
jgi:hypothetical protein